MNQIDFSSSNIIELQPRHSWLAKFLPQVHHNPYPPTTFLQSEKPSSFFENPNQIAPPTEFYDAR